MMKAGVQRALRKLGYQLQRTPAEGSLTRELQRVIEDRRVDTVLDIGAHVGLYARRLRDELSFRGRIVSFEPSPRPYRELQRRAAGDWETVQVALGDEEGTAELHVYVEHEELSSLRGPSEYGAKYGLTLLEKVQVPVRRLDDVVGDLGISPEGTLVKIDTQGHDATVMAGGREVLARCAAVQVEIPMFGLYEGAPAGTSMIQQVLDLGFDLVGMFPVHEHPRPLVPVEFDAVFARGAEAG
jgi:FkbM family methyltransferase